MESIAEPLVAFIPEISLLTVHKLATRTLSGLAPMA